MQTTGGYGSSGTLHYARLHCEAYYYESQRQALLADHVGYAFLPNSPRRTSTLVIFGPTSDDVVYQRQ
jgi:hypothetical protein